MTASACTRSAAPRNCRSTRSAVPEIRENEVLVRIHAAALNRRDLFITQGLYPRLQLPVTLGADGAGEIARLGAVFGDLRAGDEVVIDPMLGWGDNPRVWDAGHETILGMPRDGTFAQYVAVPAENVYPKPAVLSMEEAAAIPLGGLTAYRALFTRGALQRGETILITGVGGGVQTLALLFAKHAGARAIVTSSNDAKLERAQSLGADLAINYVTAPSGRNSCGRRGSISSSTPPAVKRCAKRSTSCARAAGSSSTAVRTAMPRSKCFHSFGNTSRSWERRWEAHRTLARC